MRHFKFTLLIVSASLISVFAVPKEKGDRVIPDYLRAPLKDLHDECVEESKVDTKLLEKCLDREVPDIREVKCYIDCLLRKSMVYDDNGSVDFKRVRYVVPNDVYYILDHLQKECGHINEPDGCETAYKSAKCFFDAHEATLEFCHLLVFDYKFD
uniref:CSON004330 protein n=1 Tax=Culicoides sonorensis TaxID=179676 RepID=A0A336MNV5_CULSO